MTTVLIAPTLLAAEGLVLPGEVAVTPRTLKAVRGLVVDRVVFAGACARLDYAERREIVEAIEPATLTAPSERQRKVLEDLSVWLADAADDEAEVNR